MKDDRLYLIHIIECIEKIERYTKAGKQEFMSSSLIQDGVIRNLEIIGEATKKVSSTLRDDYSEVPWKMIVGLRDVLIHDYMGVDLKRVWNVIEKELPALKKNIKLMID